MTRLESRDHQPTRWQEHPSAVVAQDDAGSHDELIQQVMLRAERLYALLAYPPPVEQPARLGTEFGSPTGGG